MKKLLTLICALLALLCAFVACNDDEFSSLPNTYAPPSESSSQSPNESETSTPEGASILLYVEVDGGYSVKGFAPNCETQNLEIPSEYNGKPVVSIAEEAFYECDFLESVVIPNSVITIENYAFKDCEALTSVTFSEGVEEIGYQAFSHIGIKSLSIPNSLEGVSSAFETCVKLESLYIPENCKVNFDGSFESCYNLKSVYIKNYESFFTAGGNGEFLAKELYLNDELVIDVVLEEGIIKIPDNAFVGFTAIKSVSLPSTLDEISYHAFAGTSLEEVKVAKNAPLTAVDSVAFKCSSSSYSDELINIKKLHVSSFMEFIAIASKFGDIEESYIDGKPLSEIKDVVIPEGVTVILKDTFKGMDQIESITIPSTVTVIHDSAFRDCTGVKKLYFNAEKLLNTDLSEYSDTLPFRNMGADSGGFDLIIGKTVKEIPESLFEAGYDFRSDEYPRVLTITFEEGSICKTIGSSAFSGCKVLKAVVLPDSIKAIKSYAFEYCSRLKLLYLGNGITDIGNGAFSYNNDNGLAFYNGTKTEWQDVINDGLSWSNIYLGEQPKGTFISSNTKIKRDYS